MTGVMVPHDEDTGWGGADFRHFRDISKMVQDIKTKPKGGT